MELDSRIIEGKRPLTCFDTEQAKEFIGKECYFSDQLCTFNKLLDAYSYVTADILVSKEKYLYVGELLTVGDSDGSCYEAGINGETEWFQFCIPCEWVKEVKYRPLTKDEFMRMFNNGVFGQWITMKSIITEKEYYMQVTGCYTSELNNIFICLGSLQFSLGNLFVDYRWKDSDGNWRVFGVEV